MTHPAFATYNKPELEKIVTYLERRIREASKKRKPFTAWMKEHFEQGLNEAKKLLNN